MAIVDFPFLRERGSVTAMPEQFGAGKVWVSGFNWGNGVRPAIRTQGPIRFYDTTLRDGEQTVGVVLDAQQKVSLARQLDSLGISRIEAGFPRVSAEDAEAIRRISEANLKAEIWGFARAARADIDALIELNLKFTVIEIPTSEVKLKAYGIAPDEAIRRAADAVSYATQHGIYVAFFPVDSTRADLGFLQKIYQAARCGRKAAYGRGRLHWSLQSRSGGVPYRPSAGLAGPPGSAAFPWSQ